MSDLELKRELEIIATEIHLRELNCTNAYEINNLLDLLTEARYHINYAMIELKDYILMKEANK